MQLGHVLTLANRSMKKPLLAAAGVALSFGVLLGSAPAAAYTSSAEAVWVGTDHYSNAIVENFIFQDRRLDNSFTIDYYGRQPYFAQLGQTLCWWWCSISIGGSNAHLDENGYGGLAQLRVFLSESNPYIVSFFNSRDSDFYRRESLYYSSETFFRDGTLSYRYRDNFIDTSFGAGISYDYDGTESYNMYYVYSSGEYYESYSYTVDMEGLNHNYEHYYADEVSGWVYDFNPFDVEEKIKSKMQLDLLPTSGVGIFDFENSFVYYAGESEGVSLAQMLADGGMGVGISFGYSEEQLMYYPGDVSGPTYISFDLTWYTGFREITGMTLAYNLPAIPEPETWAMLLAGLGLVGAVAKRRRQG
ncbi:MAG: PEPxxWA-CTERM sorting domain-containing protein [Azoarcus sp.]|jgi:hypothetical protein|nr:PEPxxWA-CTERM sorting domain-containing protein [Azoarcus sp.]